MKVVYNYDYNNKLVSINDYFNNIDYNYTYDEDNTLCYYVIYDQTNELQLLGVSIDSKGYYYNIEENLFENDNKILKYKNLINTKIAKIGSKYHTKDYVYDEIGNITNETTIYSNDDLALECYKIIKENGYKEVNNRITNLLSSSIVNVNVSNVLFDRFTFNNSYDSKLNMLSSYTLLKQRNINNVITFNNKYKYDYVYNNSLELTNEILTEYNSYNNIIYYKRINYTYDNIGNIISINRLETDNNLIQTFDYNNSLLTSVVSNNNTYKTYTYDYYGNIINIKHYDNNNFIKEEVFEYSCTNLIRYKIYNENRNIIIDFSYVYDYNNIRIRKIDNINNNITNYIIYDNKIRI